eukprot:IDg4206t1
MTMKGRTLELRIMFADQLPPHAMKRTSDAYVKAVLTHHTKAKASTSLESFVCYNTNEPHWYETFQLYNVQEDDKLSIEIWEHSLLTPPRRFAHVSVPLETALEHSKNVLSYHPELYGAVKANALTQRRLAKWYDLEGSTGRIALIVVDSAWVQPLEISAPPKRYVQFVNRKIRPHAPVSAPARSLIAVASAAAGVAKHVHPMLDIGQFVQHHMKAHATYSIHVEYIDAIFGNGRQQWNENYDAARRIFKGPLARPLQIALTKQHRYLYGSLADCTPLAGLRKHVAQTTGALLDGYDFVRLLAGGVRNGKKRAYTYVVVENELRFSETGCKIHKDIESKHAMHACAAKEVVYAGEFYFKQYEYNGEHRIRLVVDNNSGTYAPDGNDLHKVCLLFEKNFEGLVVEARDFKDNPSGK